MMFLSACSSRLSLLLPTNQGYTVIVGRSECLQGQAPICVVEQPQKWPLGLVVFKSTSCSAVVPSNSLYYAEFLEIDLDV